MILKRVADDRVLANTAQISGLVAAAVGLFGSLTLVAAAFGGLAVVTYLAHLVLHRRAQRRIAARVSELSGAVDLNHVIRGMASILGLGSSGQAWRLSLYRLQIASSDDSNVHWHLVARAANQVLFELSADYERLAIREGVLRVAVNRADAESGGVDEIPPLPDPAEDPDGWHSMMAAWGLKAPSAEASMRSRVYCGRVFRVGLSRGQGKDMTLALIAESESPTGVRKQVMEELLTRPVFELLYELLRLQDDLRESLAELQ